MPAPWYAIASKESRYSTNDYSFVPNGILEWIPDLEKNYPAIRDELKQIAEQGAFTPYFNSQLTGTQKSWKTYDMITWGVKNGEHLRQCKHTMEIMSKVPGLLSMSFSYLEPHSDIKGHSGDTNTIYRCHWGLDIPASLPECGFQVEEDQRSWENGKIFAFVDAKFHRGWNHSNAGRYIMIFDVIRPEFAAQKEEVCIKVLSALSFQKLKSYLPFIHKLPRFIKKLIFRITSILVKIRFGVATH